MECSHQEELTKYFLADGIAGIQNHLDKCNPDGNERLRLLESVRKAIDATYIDDHTLDRMQEIYEGCIAESLRIADDDESLVQHANVLSYNLSANLADCWVDAVEPRSVKHFYAGVFAAKRCLSLRKQLNKPPAAMAMAYFILGVHEYSLQQFAEANNSWSKKLESEFLSYQDPIEAKQDLNILLSRGLIALARWSLGTENEENYRESIRHLKAARTVENANECDLFVDELRLLKERHAPIDRL